jgi:spermidine synthase
VHTAVNQKRNLVLLTVLVIAWCSGCASLIYQINWQRQLTTIFGLAHYATTLTILAFFLGFTLGAYLIKRFSHRLRNTLLLIACLELVIGGYGVFSFSGFDVLGNINGALSHALVDTGTLLLGTRAVLCLFFLLLPTACMGATVPCFFSACIFVDEERGQRIGWITAANTLGALMGSVCTTWVLMGLIHGQNQMFIAAALNLMSAAVALITHTVVAPTFVRKIDASRRQSDSRPPKYNALTYAFMLSGAASLGLQILWNRLAYISLEHTSFTFALVLSIFLTAYAAGAFCSSLWLRNRPARRHTAALLQLAALSCTLAGILMFTNGLHYEQLSRAMPYQMSAVAIISIYTFLPIFFIGCSTPLILNLLSEGVATLGHDTGRAMMMNNIGSILAILIVGFILIPAANLYGVILFCTSLLLGAVLLTAGTPKTKIQSQVVYPLGALGIAALLWLVPLDPYGARYFSLYDEDPVWSAEDESGYWSVNEVSSQRGKMHYLYLNDMYENYLQSPTNGSIEGDFLLATMIKPEIRTAYSIGLGLALEPYELLRFPELDRFTTVEISPASIDLAKTVWGEYESSPFDDPRFEVIIEDGRIWLEHQERSFDLIFSGTNRSFYPGSTNLFSVEYLQMLKSRLNLGGVVQHWIPGSPDYQSAVLVKTFLAVFPDALLVAYRDPNRSSVYKYMLGFANGTPQDLDSQIQAAFSRAPAIFATTNITSAEQFKAALKIPDRDVLATLNVPLVYDDLPVVEYGRSSEKLEGWQDLNKFTKDYSPTVLKHYLQSIPTLD